jgi:hypothetical protein
MYILSKTTLQIFAVSFLCLFWIHVSVKHLVFKKFAEVMRILSPPLPVLSPPLPVLSPPLPVLSPPLPVLSPPLPEKVVGRRGGWKESLYTTDTVT